MLRREKEALGDYFGVSLVISLVAAGGGAISRRTDAAELAKTLQDRHGLELAGFDPAVVDTVVTMAGRNPQRAAELLHASWQETSVEDRRTNALRKRAEMERALAEGDAPRGQQQDGGDRAAVPAGNNPEQEGADRPANPEESSGNAPDAAKADIPNRTLFGAAEGETGDMPEVSAETEPQPQIRRLTSLSTGQEVHVFEAPDGTRSEHASLDEAFDAWEAWEDGQPAREDGRVGLGEGYLSERHAKRIKREEKGSKAWKKAVTNSILEPIVRKSSTGGNLPKGRKRKELLGEELQLTADERAILRSPHEITVVYKNGRLVNAHTYHQEKYGRSMDGYEDGHSFTHQHPNGLPPSLLDLEDALRNQGQIMRIAAEQQDGSVDLYELRVEGKIGAIEVNDLRRLFKATVDGVPDTPAQRLLAMELTVKASGGKLKFRSRRFEK